MRSLLCIVAILAIAAVVSAAEAGESKDLPPCMKADKVKELSIEEKYPVLVKAYHGGGQIDPNSVADKVADQTARVIIREHLAWEKENPAPPAQLSTRELKEMKLKLAKETIQIKKEGQAFKKLTKVVDEDDKAFKAHEKKQAAAKVARVQKAAADAVAKAKSAAEMKALAIARAKLAAQKKIAALKKKAKKSKSKKL